MKQILIVDDDLLYLDLIKLLVLGNISGKVFLACNGKQALEIIHKKKIDLILSDYHMPIMDGLELVKTLAKKKTTKNIPVIILSIDSVVDLQNKFTFSNIQGVFNKSEIWEIPGKDEFMGKIKKIII